MFGQSLFGGSGYGTSSEGAAIAAIAAADLITPAMLLDASATAVVQCLGADLTLPVMTVDAYAHDATGENEARGVLPMLALQADFGGSATMPLPGLMIDAATTGAALITAEFRIPVMSLDGAGIGAPYVATVDLTVPLMTIMASQGGGAEMALPMMALSTSTTTSGLLTASLSIPIMSVGATGTLQTRGWAELSIPMLVPVVSVTSDLSIPMLALDAVITAVVTVSYEAYSVNLTHKPRAQGQEPAVDETTHYTNFPFDRIVRYQGGYFGVAADGLYLLGGTTDDGVAIPYAVKTCIDDFGAAEKKTVASGYFGGRLGPDTTITLSAGEAGAESYTYSTPRGQLAQNHRERFGRGVKDRYFALGMAGAGELELDSVELEINKLTRRI